MIRVLVDHNMEGQAELLWDTLAADGWIDLVPLEFVRFVDIKLPITTDDRMVWRLVQAQQMILLTDNRSMKGASSLEQTLREELTTTSTPVITVGNLRRLIERDYRAACAERLCEILLDLEDYLGMSRLFIP